MRSWGELGDHRIAGSALSGSQQAAENHCAVAFLARARRSPILLFEEDRLECAVVLNGMCTSKDRRGYYSALDHARCRLH